MRSLVEDDWLPGEWDPATTACSPAAGPAWSPAGRVTEQSLRADLANANEQIRQLHDELGLLRQRLARSLGAEADVARGRATAPPLDHLEDRAAELDADNAGLCRRMAELEAEARDTSDSLDAARAANRDLMNLLNRDCCVRPMVST